MFTLEETPLFWWPVAVKVPSHEKIGSFDLQTFEMQFELVSRDESRSILKDGSAEDGNDELMRRVCKNWRKVIDGQGREISFTESTFAAAWQKAWFRAGVNGAYMKALLGEEARLGN